MRKTGDGKTQDGPVTGSEHTGWYVYIILCSDDSLYTGITTEIERRFVQHARGSGARYFRGRLPKRLVYLEVGHNRSSASSREAEIKRMTRAEKSEMCALPIGEG